jgi:hypothetical protein
MELTPEQLEQIKRQEELERVKRGAFIEGYVTACHEWTSGCVPAVTLAHKAYERKKQ